MTTDLPAIIATYQLAHDRHDTETAIATFHDDASVLDDGQTYSGVDEIRSWLDNAAREYTYVRTLTGVEDPGDGTLTVHNRLEGDFPGAQVDLRYRFEVRDGLIRSLQIGV